jgi:hypothetical protein
LPDFSIWVLALAKNDETRELCFYFHILFIAKFANSAKVRKKTPGTWQPEWKHKLCVLKIDAKSENL